MADRQGLFQEFNPRFAAHEFEPSPRRRQIERGIRIQAQGSVETHQEVADIGEGGGGQDFDLQRAEAFGFFLPDVRAIMRGQPGAREAAPEGGDGLPVAAGTESRRQARELGRGVDHGGEVG